MPTLALAILLGSQPAFLTFTGLLHDVDGRLKPTPKLLAADGKRVRMAGYVAELETNVKGGFWLCPKPVRGDESGGGTADLPPESVFVIVRSSPGTVFKPPHRPVEVSGLLQLGPKALPDGTMTHLRLILDKPDPKMPGMTQRAGRGKGGPMRDSPRLSSPSPSALRHPARNPKKP